MCAGWQTSTPGAFVEDRATVESRERLGEVATELMHLRRELPAARDLAAAAAVASPGPPGDARGDATKVAMLQERLRALQERLRALEAEHVHLQQKLASKESTPKQVGAPRGGVSRSLPSTQCRWL